MTGLVVWWPYAIVDIPDGWHNCDGQDGTPDYQNYLLIGAGDLYTPGQVLGQLSHDHLITCSESVDIVQGSTEEEYACLAEGYEIPEDYEYPIYSFCTEYHTHEIDLYTNGHDHSCESDFQSNLPPCKAGCWIQKV